MKKFFLALLVLLLVAPLTVASGSSEETSSAVMEQKEFTVEELAIYNGKDGNPAYIAHNGTVYNVTDHPKWATGSHQGQMAGTDLTEALDTMAPHGTTVLEGLPVVGILSDMAM